jgi:hypothetical protein
LLKRRCCTYVLCFTFWKSEKSDNYWYTRRFCSRQLLSLWTRSINEEWISYTFGNVPDSRLNSAFNLRRPIEYGHKGYVETITNITRLVSLCML